MSDVQGWLRIALSKFYPVIGELCNHLHDDRYRAKAGNLTARLLLVCTSLESVPFGWHKDDVEQRSQKLLTDLAQLCMGKSLKDSSAVWPQLCEFFEGNDERSLQRKWKTLLSQRRMMSNIEDLVNDCQDLVQEFFPFDIDNTSANALPDWMYLRRPHECSNYFNAGLYNLLRHYSTCVPTANCLDFAVEQFRSRHLSRLCLDPYEDDDQNDQPGNTFLDRRELNQTQRNDTVPSLELLISSVDLTYWQEVRIKIQRTDKSIGGLQRLPPGAFCGLLGEPREACVFLSFDDTSDRVPGSAEHSGLCLLADQCRQPSYKEGKGVKLSKVFDTYELTTKDKIALAHSVVLAYWQLYGSDLTHNGWTSDTIYLMYQKDEVKGGYTLPLRSYLTFPFDAACAKQPIQHQGNCPALHSFPAILAIGTILLEIALSKALPSVPSDRRSPNSCTNARLRIAEAHLKLLKTQTWENFGHKRYFDNAVECCLNFKDTQGQKPAAPRYKGNTAREDFYLKVVCPMTYLSKFGFGTQRGRCARRKKQPERQPEEQPLPLEEPRGELHTFQLLDSEGWLEDLKEVCRNVEKERRMHRVTDPVKVAILDTGCDLSLIPSSDNFNVDWKDFLNESPTPQDSYGHGTLMTRLILECSPCAKIIVARIARDMKGLQDKQNRIAEAIQWAGIDQKANIISMSFGFVKNNDTISRAIDEVKRRRQVIFLSSAGNSPSEYERFPARHPYVASIYAASHEGAFYKSNPKSWNNGKVIMGTFGGDVPANIRTAFEKRFPGVYQPGSSIATAVATSMSIIILVYVTMLPKLLEPALVDTDRLQWLWETAGMEAVLKTAVARSQVDPRRFLDLASFWRDNTKDQHRLYSIMNSLADVDSTGQLLL